MPTAPRKPVKTYHKHYFFPFRHTGRAGSPSMTGASFGYPRDGIRVTTTNCKLIADRWVRANFLRPKGGGTTEWRWRACGLDCEFKKKGTARVLQLAAPTGQVLVHHFPRKQLGNTVRRLLKDPLVLKVGVGVQDDARALRVAGVEVAGAVDSRTVIRTLKGSAYVDHGLEGFADRLLGIAIKPGFTSAWGEPREIDNKSSEYAAWDGFASLETFRVPLGQLNTRQFAEWEQAAINDMACYQ
ncbi:hypothetical protein HDV00_001603 [Rhizophlyctis rosea]|nr:hypothetical protein HDV00_001603 [Rhizophlyctis rosea]